MNRRADEEAGRHSASALRDTMPVYEAWREAETWSSDAFDHAVRVGELYCRHVGFTF